MQVPDFHFATGGGNTLLSKNEQLLLPQELFILRRYVGLSEVEENLLARGIAIGASASRLRRVAVTCLIDPRVRVMRPVYGRLHVTSRRCLTTCKAEDQQG